MTLVVLAGQSNALGWSEISELPPEMRAPQPQVRIWNPQTGAFEVLEAGRNTGDAERPEQAGPEVAFAYAWAEAHPGETLYLVKTAQSSTGLAADPAQFDWAPSSGELFAQATSRINAAEIASGEPVAAILWMQGEHDASPWDKATAYQANLTDLFAAMRQQWGDGQTPIVFGRISENGGQPYAQLVRDAQDAVDNADPSAIAVDTDGFSMRPDNLHYDTAGQVALGRAFFGAYQELAGEVGAAPEAGATGRTYMSYAPGSSLVGGAGDDTLVASQGLDTLTGGEGADVFQLPSEPWAPIVITDFAIGADGLDLSALFQASGYVGADPVADRYVYLESNGAGGTLVRFDRDAAGGQPQWPNTIVNLQNVSPASVTWAKLQGGGGVPADATPVANPDSDVVVLGSGAPATGNVITDHAPGDAGDSDAGADQGGADGSLSVVALRTTHTADTDPADGFVQIGRFGTLTMQPNGDYSYELTSSPQPGVTDTFGYQVRDRDGDTATASLSITVQRASDAGAGQALTSSGPGSTLVGGAGNDTLSASAGLDTLTGGAGADVFRLTTEPWAPIRVTDFQVGQDALDISALLQKSGYAGADPIADRYLYLESNGAGGTTVRFDRDAAGPNPQWPNTVVELQNVSPSNLGWSQLTGSGGGAHPPPPGTGAGPPPSGGNGQVLTSPGPGSTLVGGAGSDTLNASQGLDTLTGGGGADVFSFGSEPWAPIHLTDFTPGVDKLDLSALFRASGYAGSDSIGDRYIYVEGDGKGGSLLRFDRDAGGPNPQWPNTIIHLDIVPGQVLASDWIIS